MSALTVFLSVGAIGLIFLLFSFLFGELIGELHLEADLDHDGPGFISTRVISMFLTAFGVVGALSVSQGLSAVSGTAIGLASGLLMGGLVYLYARFLYSQQA